MALRQPVASSLAGRLFGRDAERTLLLLRAAWPRAVGAELARRTELVALEKGTLRVRVPDARWRRELHRLRKDILTALRGLAGELAPRRLGFVEGAVAAPPPAAPHAPVDTAAEAPDAVQRHAEAIADPEIRALFVASAGRYLSRRRSPA